MPEEPVRAKTKPPLPIETLDEADMLSSSSMVTMMSPQALETAKKSYLIENLSPEKKVKVASAIPNRILDLQRRRKRETDPERIEMHNQKIAQLSEYHALLTTTGGVEEM
jgi:hypothetical protein